MQNDSKNLLKRGYLPNLPYMTPEGSQKFFGLILTLCALAFFGFLAIRPTVSTILKLEKEAKDDQDVLNQMDTKIKNLTELRKQFFNLQGDLPIVTNAITIQPDVSVLFAQIQSIARTEGITITKLQNFEVEILRNNNKTDKNYSSYAFTVAGSGSHENVSKFIQMLTNMERVINIDVFSVNNKTSQIGGSLGFNVQGTAFFKSDL